MNRGHAKRVLERPADDRRSGSGGSLPMNPTAPAVAGAEVGERLRVDKRSIVCQGATQALTKIVATTK